MSIAEDSAGAPAADPRILLERWLYGFLKGVGSARELDWLCREHLAWQWLCGGTPTNNHSLSDFRAKHEAFLDELLTYSAALLMHRGLAGAGSLIGTLPGTLYPPGLACAGVTGAFDGAVTGVGIYSGYRDEVVVWDPESIWIYAQDDGPKAARLYKPVRNGLWNSSNYQATVSLPGWEE